jgi:hypothetical protein
MAGRNRYFLAKECLQKCQEKYGILVGIETLKTFIRIYCGADEQRTVLPYLQLMQDTGLIKENSQGWQILLENAQ